VSGGRGARVGGGETRGVALLGVRQCDSAERGDLDG